MKDFKNKDNRFELLLVAIIKANLRIQVEFSGTPEVVREVFDKTGILISAKPAMDYYESNRTDRYGDPYMNNRINRRKFTLTIR